MLTIKTITEQRDEVIRRLAVKHFDATEIIDRIIALDKTRRASQTALDANLTEVNRLSKQIGGLMKEGKRAEADEAKAEVSRLKEANRTLEADKTQAEKDMHELLVLIPNLPHASVPEGTGADDTRCEETGGPPVRRQGASVVVLDGAPVLYASENLKVLISYTSEREELVRALAALAADRQRMLAYQGAAAVRRRTVVESLNGVTSLEPAVSDLLRQAGFVRDPKGMRLAVGPHRATWR